MNQEQLYVSATRGKERLTLFTDDKESVAQAIRRSSQKAAALDVKPMPQAEEPKRRDWLAEQRDRLRRLDFFKRLRRASAMPPPQPERQVSYGRG